MSGRRIRGVSLWRSWYEPDQPIELAPRRSVRFDCPQGHDFAVTMSLTAEVPPTWDCPNHGLKATCRETARNSAAEKPARTHWDMLLERRSLPELQDLLAERIALLRHNRNYDQPNTEVTTNTPARHTNALVVSDERT